MAFIAARESVRVYVPTRKNGGECTQPASPMTAANLFNSVGCTGFLLNVRIGVSPDTDRDLIVDQFIRTVRFYIRRIDDNTEALSCFIIHFAFLMSLDAAAKDRIKGFLVGLVSRSTYLLKNFQYNWTYSGREESTYNSIIPRTRKSIRGCKPSKEHGRVTK